MLKVPRCFVVIDAKKMRARRYVDGKLTADVKIFTFDPGVEREIEAFRLWRPMPTGGSAA